MPLAVPQINWINQRLYDVRSKEGSNTFNYFGPSPALQRIVAATAAQGQILTITPPALNTSWSLDFWGPAIHCSEVTGSERTSISDNYGSFLRDLLSGGSSPPAYLSWPNQKPFRGSNGTWELDTRPLRRNGRGETTLFIAYDAARRKSPWPVYTDIADDAGVRALGGWSAILGNVTMLKCNLYNASYSVDFNYSTGQQDITVERSQETEDRLLYGWLSFRLPRGPTQSFNCTTDVTGQTDTTCFSAALAKTASYQAIHDAFSSHIYGQIDSRIGTFSLGTVSTSAVQKTILTETPELEFLQFEDDGQGDSQVNSPVFVGRDPATYPRPGALIDALERLFENVTISVLSSAYFQWVHLSIVQLQDTTNAMNLD